MNALEDNAGVEVLVGDAVVEPEQLELDLGDQKQEEPPAPPTEEQVLQYCVRIHDSLVMLMREAHGVVDVLRVIKAEAKRARKKEARRKAQEFKDAVLAADKELGGRIHSDDAREV